MSHFHSEEALPPLSSLESCHWWQGFESHSNLSSQIKNFVYLRISKWCFCTHLTMTLSIGCTVDGLIYCSRDVTVTRFTIRISKVAINTAVTFFTLVTLFTFTWAIITACRTFATTFWAFTILKLYIYSSCTGCLKLIFSTI